MFRLRVFPEFGRAVEPRASVSGPLDPGFIGASGNAEGDFLEEGDLLVIGAASFSFHGTLQETYLLRGGTGTGAFPSTGSVVSAEISLRSRLGSRLMC